MDLNEIMIFIKVVQSGSFSKASEALSLPKSTVSHKVSSLEKRLGMTLIQRTTRKLNITPEGQVYFKHCLQGLTEIQSAETELAAQKGEPQGLLRISAPVDLGNSVMPDLLSRFTRKYPQVRIEVILTERRVDFLAESIDLAIRAGDLKDSSLIAKKIGAVYFVPVASPRYLKNHAAPTHPRELRQHECLHFTSFGNEEWHLVSGKGSLNIPVPSRMTINNLEVVKKLALNGEGIALLPTHLCHAEVRSGALARILPEWRTQITPVHFVYPSQRFVTPKLSAFIELATGSLKKNFENFGI